MSGEPTCIPVPWQMVTCRACGCVYRCTPDSDYYNNTTTEDGLCELCLITEYLRLLGDGATS